MAEQGAKFSGIIRSFLQGQLSVLLIVISLAAGAVALVMTPREEEPQIVVPLADVMVSYPGGSAEEVERRVASRLERLLYQIDGVEYVYSMSRPGQAVVTVRFYVGQDREASLIKLYNKIFQNIDRTTPGIAGWVVKPIEIDDVPIVTAALYSDRYGTHELYRVAEEVAGKLQHVHNSARITLHGGEPRAVRVLLDPERLSAHNLSPLEIAGALKVSNSQAGAGSLARGNREIVVEVGPFLRDADEVRNLMVGVHGDRPVYLRDVAEVLDGPDEPAVYSRIGFGPADAGAGGEGGREYGAVTVAVAKKKGSNAVWVSRDVERTLEDLRGTMIPDDVRVRVTRDYGETANEKVNDLVKSLGEAIITVIALIALAMNWRVGIIVALAVPITYALTLMVNLLAGYTINRVTLFALILALGLLVDDPIVAVENIYRHLLRRRLPPDQAIQNAMGEVMPPVILATLSVIVAFLPMFFITGMMGPYMRPMALNVPLAMLSSLLVSFTVTPWISKKMLAGRGLGGAHGGEDDDVSSTATYRVYSRLMRPFVHSRSASRFLLLVMAVLFGAAVWMALAVVPLKMLPFDNKNEFQVVVDMPESATLEATDAATREVEQYLRTVPEVRDFTTVVGGASPMDFNGLVRHYYLRQGPNVADIRVGLLHRSKREMDSHALVLRLRNDFAEIAKRTGANLKLVEMPPGPPVLASLVAEIYGRDDTPYADLIAVAQTVKARMAEEPGVVDVDDWVEADQQRLFFEVDREKAALNGVSTEVVAQTLQIALGGMPAGVVHRPAEQNELPVVLRLPREARTDVERLRSLAVKGQAGRLVQIGELGRFRESLAEKTIFHKNQERVVYVNAEVAGRGPAYAVLALQKHFKDNPPPAGVTIDWKGEGEWKITLDVFRDLGMAFAAALLAIYVLLVYETKSYMLPLVVMMSIPMTLIGIMPGFSLLNAIVNQPVGGFANPVFFTATAMIGMIALAGIVVRNGIILIDFIRTTVERGRPLREAILESGAVRLRPIVLTAGTTMLGAWPITLDPIFSGLAWSLIFGLFISTAFTLFVIPATYNLLYGGKAAAPAPEPAKETP
ncbi:MAG: efflux RND transporter permease subunit [Lentisphaerae bacterium]|nr:efflux RND transporter permease subunit [Lentisphaerota bacterium]